MWLENLKWTDLKRVVERVFVVPLGSLEQHGPHLPLATDTAIVSEIARRVEAALSDHIVLAPTQWLGYSPHHSYFGCVSADLRPYMEIIKGVGRSLVGMGARKIFLLNGHGGNDIPCKAALLELKAELPHYEDLNLIYATYWSLAAEDLKKIRSSPRGGVGHACEMETSIMLAMDPERVSMADAADAGTFDNPDPYHVLDMLHPQPYFAVRHFHELSPSGTLGMPSLASAEKGQQFLTAIERAVVQFIRDFFKVASA